MKRAHYTPGRNDQEQDERDEIEDVSDDEGDSAAPQDIFRGAVLFVKPDARPNRPPLMRLFMSTDSARAIRVFTEIKMVQFGSDQPAVVSKNIDRVLNELLVRASRRPAPRVGSFFDATTPFDALPERVRIALDHIPPLDAGHSDVVSEWSHVASNANVPILRVLSFTPNA